MTLGTKQKAFLPMLAKLITYAYAQGYELTLGDAYRDPRVFGAVGIKQGYGEAKSCHKVRLAIDLNLFKGGVYLTATEDYTPLGVYWESLGGSWGGRFKDGDHFSIENEGMR
jgi:hypothetical protein